MPGCGDGATWDLMGADEGSIGQGTSWEVEDEGRLAEALEDSSEDMIRVGGGRWKAHLAQAPAGWDNVPRGAAQRAARGCATIRSLNRQGTGYGKFSG